MRARHIDSDGDLGLLVDQPPADADPEVLKRLGQLYEAGAWVLVESAIADLPADLRWLYEGGAVTLAQLAILHDRLGATSLTDLIDAVARHRIRSAPGLDETVENAIETALPNIRQSIPRIPLGRAVALVDPILEQLRGSAGIHWAEPVGSLRRAEETVGDIEIVAAAGPQTSALDQVAQAADVDRVLHQSTRRLYLLINRAQVGVRLADPSNAGATLLHLTGSRAHVGALQARASARGWQLTPEGLVTPDGTPQPSETEEEIYSALQLPFIPPEIRNGEEEIDVAARAGLPRLLSRQDIRGDLHMHSLWSDGRDSVEVLARMCRDLGYEYMAITDHSPKSGASRTLTAQTVGPQADEIAAVRERFPEITILHGCEVDILPEGRLDFPERILAQFDIVLASLHHRAGQSPDQLLRRYVSAMRHPLVSVITHPTNRLLPHRPGYDLDYDRLFEAAVETGTCLEIDGAPVHLDMDGALARRAIAAGASVTVSSDGHRADLLGQQMRLGIATARRGWVEPRHVLNTRPLADVRAAIQRKHRG